MRPRSISSRALAGAAGVAGVVLAALALLLLARGHEPPPLVIDTAALMAPAQRDFLSTFHGLLLDDHDIDYRVVTVGADEADAGDIDGYAVARFEDLFARARSRTGRGLLLVVDPARDRVRLEVSFALEGAFPDAFVAYVENRQMVPFFRTGRIADGILASTELIVARAQRAAASAGFEGEAWATESGGAGAATDARIGRGPETIATPATPPQATAAQGSLAETLDAYFAAMAARNASPELAFYTPATQAMLRGWTVTRAQMDSVVKTYRRCTAEPARVGPEGKRAVIRYPVAQRDCAPFFFEKIGGAWALDLTMMQRAIRFGRTNAWRFDPAADHPYRFAFADWRFDRNGFPAGAR